MEEKISHPNIDIIAEPIALVSSITSIDNTGKSCDISIVNERPLTIYLNRVEIVTVMTMGAYPVYLVIGFLLNQQLIDCVDDIQSIHIDWDVSAAAVVAKQSNQVSKKIDKRVVTTGCGQGTMFASIMDNAVKSRKALLDIAPLTPENIYTLLGQLSDKNVVYRQAGGVHSCAVCSTDKVIKMIEDVGRHNAVDSLTGFLALNPPKTPPAVMYTTGRLTSEMVIKSVQMGLPMIISRSGSTAMGVEIARSADITLISRAKGRRFLVLSGEKRIKF